MFTVISFLISMLIGAMITSEIVGSTTYKRIVIQGASPYDVQRVLSACRAMIRYKEPKLRDDGAVEVEVCTNMYNTAKIILQDELPDGAGVM